MKAGDHIDRYTIERVLGEGGMSVVYLARHRRLRSMHAIKVLQVNGQQIRKRLVLEGRVQASLKHPNVVAVTDVIEQGNTLALVMEYVNGPTLYELVQEPMSVDEALRIFRGIATGIAAAHEAGLVHRDLKPANIIMARTNVGMVPKVSDFGLVKVIEEGNTRTGLLMGTPNYMSPEQINDASTVDHRADLWALGVMLYEMLTGTTPFAAKNHLTTFNNVANREMYPVTSLRPDLPRDVVDVVNGLITVDINKRIQSANELLSRLFEDGQLLDGPDHADDFRDTLFTPIRAMERAPDEPVVPIEPTRLHGDETPTPSPRSDPAKRTTKWRFGLVMLVIPMVLLAASIVVISVFASQFIPPSSPAPPAIPKPVSLGPVRDATINIVGIEDGIDVVVVSSGQRVTRQGSGPVLMTAIPVGGANLGWAAGMGCTSDSCPAQCEAWCTTGDTSVDVPAGDGAVELGLIAFSASPRAVIIRGSRPISRARLGTMVGVPDGSNVVFDGVHPGRHLLFIDVGECPDSALDCSNDPGLECPVGCASMGQAITVAASTQTMDVNIELPSPASAAPQARNGTPALVSGDAFARWLIRHPEWDRDVAIDDGRVNRRYLRNWTPSPPGGAVTLVSWEAASAYCQGHGGVRPVNAAPMTWSGALDEEWRSDEGGPAARTSDGDIKTGEPNGRAIADRGFRCAH